MEDLIDGILLVDKAEGETSHDVVKKVKSILGGAKGIKVGHAGTLDPFATGLLIILLGQGTKLSRFIMSEDKVYLAVMRLGVGTDTLDLTGKVIRTGVVPNVDINGIREKAASFVGNIRQVPPAYSAVKYKGERAYKLARQGGAMDLEERLVTVHSLRIISVDLPHVTMEIRCSGGTYIRSLASDLGKSLGTVGHLKSLRRLASGGFKAEDALNSGDPVIAGKVPTSALQEKIIPMRDALMGMREIEAGDLLASKVRKGYQPAWRELVGTGEPAGFDEGYIKLVGDGELVAIMKANKSKGVENVEVKIERVFL